MHFIIDSGRLSRRLKHGSMRLEDIIDDLGMAYQHAKNMPDETVSGLNDSVEKLHYACSRLNELVDFVEKEKISE